MSKHYHIKLYIILSINQVTWRGHCIEAPQVDLPGEIELAIAGYKGIRFLVRPDEVSVVTFEPRVVQICNNQHNESNEINGALGHDFACVRLYWAGYNLGECDEFCYESYPWCRIDRSTNITLTAHEVRYIYWLTGNSLYT